MLGIKNITIGRINMVISKNVVPRIANIRVEADTNVPDPNAI